MESAFSIFLQRLSRNHDSPLNLLAAAIFLVKIERNFCSVKRGVSRKRSTDVLEEIRPGSDDFKFVENLFTIILPRYYIPSKIKKKISFSWNFTPVLPLNFRLNQYKNFYITKNKFFIYIAINSLYILIWKNNRSNLKKRFIYLYK